MDSWPHQVFLFVGAAACLIAVSRMLLGFAIDTAEYLVLKAISGQEKVKWDYEARIKSHESQPTVLPNLPERKAGQPEGSQLADVGKVKEAPWYDKALGSHF